MSPLVLLIQTMYIDRKFTFALFFFLTMLMYVFFAMCALTKNFFPFQFILEGKSIQTLQF